MSANFGYELEPASSTAFLNKINGTKATCPEVGTGDSITVRIMGWGAGEKVKCCLYDASQNKLADGETEERTTGGTSGDWFTFNFLSPPSLVNAAYFIVAMSDSETHAYYDYGGASGYVCKFGCPHTYGDGFPASISGCGTDYANSAVCIYCTYTAGGPPPAAKTLVQAALISVMPLIAIPTLAEILRCTGA